MNPQECVAVVEEVLASEVWFDLALVAVSWLLGYVWRPFE
jgi:hypothetical protein